LLLEVLELSGVEIYRPIELRQLEAHGFQALFKGLQLEKTPYTALGMLLAIKVNQLERK
jgi:hypothetical protein